MGGEGTMTETEELNFIRNTVFKTVDFKQDIVIDFYESDGISVEYGGKKAKIRADCRVGFARGCFLLAMNLSEGKKSFVIQENAHFRDLGVMLDCSRNGVMKVESIKKYLNCIASLGFNLLMLYTEDTYEIKNRPRFGYMRGRYTHEELREIIAHGEKLGIELIPCIQTLGHLGQYLQYSACRGRTNYDTGEKIDTMTNTYDTLLMECEETYRFIEDEIRTCREIFSSKRIHVGMDEAENAFIGKFLQQHGVQPKYEVLSKHLTRVTEICKKYDFKPMMWSDMYFRSASKKGIYRDPNAEFSPEFVQSIPDVEMVYWDYSYSSVEQFDGMIKKHAELKKPINFVPAIQTWLSPLVCHDSTVLCVWNGLKACLKNKDKINMVMVALWGDDGCMANYLMANSLLPYYSEHCYKGEACTEEDIRRASEFLTKMPLEAANAMGDANCVVDEENGWRMQAKRLLYGDILYDMSCDLQYADAILANYSAHAEVMKKQMALNDKNYIHYRYAWLVYEIGIKKVELRQKLQKAYLKNDRDYLRYVAEELLPYLADTVDELRKCHQKQWESTYKMFGYEVHCYRYGGIVARIREIAERLSRYLGGEIAHIEELEAERIPNGLSFCTVRQLVTPSSIC